MFSTNIFPKRLTVSARIARQDLPRFNHEQLRAYLFAQLEEIQKYKWIESERLGHDIGFERAMMEWNDRFGKDFRGHWIQTAMA